MNVKKSIIVILTFFLVLPFFSETASAASLKTGYVSLSNGTLNVRSGPGTNYKVVGSLQNNQQIIVYSQTKSGWSEIRFNKKKAFVSTKYLRFYSYKMNPLKKYTYTSEGGSYPSVYQKKFHGWDQWVSGGEAFLVREDSKGLYMGFPESEYFLELAYPLSIGRKWTQFEVTSRIVDMNKKLTTKAGTFRGVVTVKTSDGFTNYYAQNVGLIKSLQNGKTVSELTKLENK